MNKIIAEIGRTLGRAVLAGVGVELARLASLALRKKLTPEEVAAEEKKQAEEADLKAENEKLKAELATLKEQLRAPPPRPDDAQRQDR